MAKNPCVPDVLPLADIDWKNLVALMGKAGRSIARYDGTLNGMVNAAVLLSPITDNEAVLSSKIEGTEASLSEVLQHEAGEQFDGGKERDIQEVLNYRRALLVAQDYLRDRTITLSLMRELHMILMDSVRGKDKNPGQFRTDQNWVGRKGAGMAQARFIPPNPIIMKEALDNLEKFIAQDFDEPLVQLAIIHAQFEIIHPFSDGNGRLGRMLIPLFLFQKRELQSPVFYLSEYLEKHDEEYRDRLLAITEAGDWHGWIQFFLEAVNTQAQRNTEKARRILDLYEDMKIKFSDATKSQFSVAALDAFFSVPIMSATNFSSRSKIKNKATANNILKALCEDGLITLYKEASGRRPAIYAMPELINIAEGKEIFVKRVVR